MDTEEFLADIDERVIKLLDRGYKRVSASLIGLDPRAGSVWVNPEDQFIVAAPGSIRQLEYYGGFEYVDAEHVWFAGGYKFYSGQSDRVAEAIDTYIHGSNRE